MSASEVLCCPVAISVDPTVQPLPSVHEIVKAHFKRLYGDAGNGLAAAYLDRVATALNARAAAQVNPGKGPEDGPRTKPLDETVPDNCPAPEAAAQLRDAVALSIIGFLNENTQRDWFSIQEIEALLKAWQASTLFRKRFKILTMPDTDGGFAEHVESGAHIGAVIRALVRNGRLLRDGSRFALSTAGEAETPSQGANKATCEGKSEDKEASAFDTVLAMLSSLGIGKQDGRRATDEIFPDSFIPGMIAAVAAANLGKP
jgi:hypothetical protein